MDPFSNPLAPGAGTAPPELAGRDALRETARIAMERIRRGNPAKSLVLVGLRGAGKTVLLDRLRLDAEAAGLMTLQVEAPERHSLPAILAPQLRLALLRLSRIERAKELALRGLRGLAGFARALKVKYHDIEVGLDAEPEPGLADNGNLEQDLQALMELAGGAAREAETALVLCIDELQYVPDEQLEALVTSLHRVAQRRLPVLMLGAGLPQLRGQMGRAKSCVELLFDYPEIGLLPPEEVRRALEKPALDLGVRFEEAALDAIVERTQGYPYFPQEWGKHVWETAAASPITRHDVDTATGLVLAALDVSFFRVRFDRMNPSERRYLRAMAELGPGPYRSGDVAEQLGRAVTALVPIRSQLIAKGMIWSPGHGDTAFIVPLFDEFMRRILPGDDWRTQAP